jgi:hypothetical protein
MKKVSISLFITLLAVLGVLAQTKPQDYLFKVLISSGDNSIIKNGKWETVKIGTQLGKNDQVRVEGFLGLQHNSGKTVEIKTAGTYKVADLVSKVPTGNSSVAEKYASFVAKRMAGGGNGGTNQNATGASERGIYLFANLPYKAAGGTLVIGDKLTIHWIKDPQKKTKTYNVKLEDMYGEKLMSTPLTDTSYTIDLTKLKPGESYNLHITSKENTLYQSDDNPYVIQRPDAKTEKEILNEFASLKPAEGELTAMEAVSIAGFFEEKKLIVNAAEYYEKAMKLEPNVPEFKETYKKFIKENKIGKLDEEEKKKTK